MRVRVVAENLIERVGIALNLAPTPVAESLWGPAASGILIAGVRTGVIPALAEGPVSVDELVRKCGLAAEPTRLLLDCLVAQRHARVSGSRYQLDSRAKKWLDPKSPTYCGEFIASHQDYWLWWSGLTDVVRTGKHFEMHSLAADDPYWKPYITGQFELARLSAPEVASALKLPENPTSLLDVAGAHGWFSATLCRKYPDLTATVVDLPGSARVGEEIIATAGMSDRVEFRTGDALSVDLGGPYDAALCFNLIHHLSPDQILQVFRRVHDVLKPGGTFAVLDLFRRPENQRPDGSSLLGLFFHLQTGNETYSRDQLVGWLQETGFTEPRRVPIRRIPVQTLYEARRVD
jgi:ubiquinone/menaquinone biosynthesis C-methylase UbiE